MSRQNNFDALRLAAAVAVMFSPAFLIADGTQKNEWLIRPGARRPSPAPARSAAAAQRA